MNKITTIIIGIVLVILGALALIPALNFAVMWLAIVLIVIGILSVVLGLMSKRSMA